MKLPKHIVIPVDFIEAVSVQALAVNDDGLIRMLGLDDGRTREAAMLASWRFRSVNNIKTLPGGVYPVAAIKRAMAQYK